MSQIRIAKAVDVGAFPGSKFVIDGSPPIAQCQETERASPSGKTTGSTPLLENPAVFPNIDLATKILSITAPPANVGDYTILSNTDDVLTLATIPPAFSEDNIYTVHDVGQTYLTRNESSFQRFIESQGKAHTTKGGQLYTDISDPPMDDACSDTWSPD
ncbi:hypothetical protein ES707_19619 [subsurface metagenome]